MITLDSIAERHKTDKCKLLGHGYCDIYERYFGHLRDEPVTILELGIQYGLSLKMWAEFFHRSEVYGVDTMSHFSTDNPHIHVFQGDASHALFWNGFARGVTFDIVIEDSDHRDSTQEVVFKSLWPRVKPGGYFVIEDTFTYWDTYFNHQLLPLFVREIIAAVNLTGKQYHGKPNPIADPQFTELEREVEYVHFYKGLMIVRKK
jgi:SAM-dependent methyltransferase